MSYHGADVPPQLLARLRKVCLSLPGASEEAAWVGTRWVVRKKNFAHVLSIYDGKPKAYARAAGSDGPLAVLTFRATRERHAALCARGAPFFDAVWGTTWGTRVVGMRLDGKLDWKELAKLLAESHRLLAPPELPRAGRARP